MATASPPPVVTMQLEALQIQSDEEDVKEEDDSFLIPDSYVQQRPPIAQPRLGVLHAGVSPFRPIATASSAGPTLPMIPARASLEFTEPETSPGTGAAFLEGHAGRPGHSRIRNLSRGEGRLPVFYTLQVKPRRCVKWHETPSLCEMGRWSMRMQEAVSSWGWWQALGCLATIHGEIFAGGFWIGTRVFAAIGPLLPNQQHRQCVPPPPALLTLSV